MFLLTKFLLLSAGVIFVVARRPFMRMSFSLLRKSLGSLLLLHKRRRIDLYRSNLVLTKNYACRAGSPERTKQKS